MQFTSLIVSFVLAITAASASVPLRIVSWNIRYAASSLEINEKPWWDLFCWIDSSRCRQPHVIAHLQNITSKAAVGEISIFGLQEVLDNQLSDVKSGLGSNWAHLGFGRDDGATSGEYNPILYRSDMVSVVYSEMKWLSTTPDVVSYGWGAGSRRVVTIGVFEDKTTGKRFIHANTHLDNVSSQARSEGIKVVVARIQAVQATYGPLSVTLTGDFNSEPSGDAYATLQATGYLTEIWNSGAVRLGTNQLTYTGFTATGISRIDYIWLGPTGQGKVTGTQFEIWNNNVDGMFISDHRAVVADLVVV
ncbi:endonuclease/Exonuclease/phosphatase [Leptodontidium sp. 2 PMI_412]|nr:endonuclease/Exonuclease/phosphatase [Leptodontidium sp. MPI-SDFR-AT-0119]KAH9205277.1 endonuclease/Exonuclease/phosphatase [Leptodontidium sp. 2 PMI_412]